MRALALLVALSFAVPDTARAAPSITANLRLTVQGVTAAGGTLRVGLYDEATFLAPVSLPLRKQDIARVAGDVSVGFDRLPPGSYAVKAFQDIDNDSKWEPGEPQGISNGAAPGDFDAAALTLMPGNTMAVVRLR